VAARRRDLPHGPIAQRLWRFIAEQAPVIGARRGSAPADMQHPARV